MTGLSLTIATMAIVSRTLLATLFAALPGCTAGPTDPDPPRIEWPAAGTQDQAARLSLSADGTRSEAQISALLARSPVPVLVPRDRTLEKPTLSVGREYFALTGRDRGTTIHTQGTRAATRHAEIAPVAGNRDMRGTKGFVTENEGIRTAAWVEHGAAYSVDVECSQHDDARCQSDAYLLDVVSHLVFVQ
jgi:hypothetical protein